LPPPTREQTSAGGVTLRQQDGRTEVVLILTGPEQRWQLPKGVVEPGEAPEAAALREVREETGIVAELVEPLDTIEYWFFVTERADRLRIHKRVHFYLLRAIGGDVKEHDHEVLEARWVGVDEAVEMLAFKNEREVVRKAAERAAAL
jgi:8-oxo-dGTP pyrophosphatase MutT (NUDIX family)